VQAGNLACRPVDAMLGDKPERGPPPLRQELNDGVIADTDVNLNNLATTRGRCGGSTPAYSFFPMRSPHSDNRAEWPLRPGT